MKKIRQRKTNTAGYHLHVESKKYNKLVNKKEAAADSQIKRTTSGYLWGERTTEGNYRDGG